MSRPAITRRERSRLACFFAAALAASLCGGSASAQDKPGDSVSARLSRLEDQVIDLQVLVGTLESLLRVKPGVRLEEETGGTAQIVVPSATGDAGPRIDAVETQIGALTGQIEQLTKEVGALAGKLSTTEEKLSAAEAKPSVAPTGQIEQLEKQIGALEGKLAAVEEKLAAAEAKLSAAPPLPPAPQALAPKVEEAPKPSSPALAAAGGDAPQSGETLMPADDEDPSPPPLTDETAPQPLRPPLADDEREDAAAPTPSPTHTASIPDADATTLYTQGYGDLLRRNYPAAETAFSQLVETHPKDPLAGKAQFWLGETYFMRGQFKAAADAFLKGYKDYQASEKAPDSLLKLGMALAELGQKDAACDSFNELGTKFPTADKLIHNSAKLERQKTGC